LRIDESLYHAVKAGVDVAYKVYKACRGLAFPAGTSDVKITVEHSFDVAL
jgi:hypothetical protein